MIDQTATAGFSCTLSLPHHN